MGQGGSEGGKGRTILRRRYTLGARNHCVGRRKGPTMSQVLSSVEYICFRKTSSSNMGAPNSKRVYCPGRHLTLFRAGMKRKIEAQETIHQYFYFCAPCQSGAHGTCHAIHTVDTPLVKPLVMFESSSGFHL